MKMPKSSTLLLALVLSVSALAVASAAQEKSSSHFSLNGIAGFTRRLMSANWRGGGGGMWGADSYLWDSPDYSWGSGGWGAWGWGYGPAANNPWVSDARMDTSVQRRFDMVEDGSWGWRRKI